MGQKQSTKRPGAGRPPSGPDGESVSEYPRLTIRLPRATKNALTGLSALRGHAAWQIVDAAVLAYVEALPPGERRLLAQFAAGMKR